MSEFGEADHEEGHEDEPWLVSYADLMTLLFGFFVLMYTFAMAKLNELNPDEYKYMVQMRKEVATFFGGEFVTPLKEVAESFKTTAAELKVKDEDWVIDLSPEELSLTLKSSAIFDSGSAELSAIGRIAITKLIEVVQEKNEAFKVVVEGHTDDVPLKPGSRFPTNWELSGARASTVVRLFESKGFRRNLLMAIGYADTRPKAPNRKDDNTPIPENRAKNRRVTIKIGLDIKDRKLTNAPVQTESSPNASPKK